MPCSAAPAPACPAALWRRMRQRSGRAISRVSRRFYPRGRPMSEDRDRRWRLALGGEDEVLDQRDQRLSGALTALYGEGDADERKRKGGLGSSVPNVARWMSDIREYFPSPVVQIVQKDAFERLGLQRMLLEPEFLAAVEADINLVATLISLRSVMPEKTQDTARQVIAKVVAELMERLQRKTPETLRAAAPNPRPPPPPPSSPISPPPPHPPPPP